MMVSRSVLQQFCSVRGLSPIGEPPVLLKRLTNFLKGMQGVECLFCRSMDENISSKAPVCDDCDQCASPASTLTLPSSDDDVESEPEPEDDAELEPEPEPDAEPVA